VKQALTASLDAAAAAAAAASAPRLGRALAARTAGRDGFRTAGREEAATTGRGRSAFLVARAVTTRSTTVLLHLAMVGSISPCALIVARWSAQVSLICTAAGSAA